MQQDSNDPTGVSGKEGSPGLIRARERKANAATELRLSGAEWSDIAQILGYPTARAAQVAYEKAQEASVFTEESQQSLRNLAGRRLERLLRSAWVKAVDPKNPEHLQAISKAVVILDRHARLYGYDAPQELVVHSPTAQELEAWVSRVTQVEVPELEQGSIFEADIVEDDDDQSA